MIVNLSDSVFAEFEALEIDTFDPDSSSPAKGLFVADLLDETTRRIRSSGRLVHRVNLRATSIDYALAANGAIDNTRSIVADRGSCDFGEASLDANILRSLDALERKLQGASL